jgi:sugar lactone lactonase YvrE
VAAGVHAHAAAHRSGDADRPLEAGEPRGDSLAGQHRQAEAVAAINLASGSWKYDLKTLPRPKGKETQVIYTTWELPVTMRPHDTRIGLDGSIWFNGKKQGKWTFWDEAGKIDKEETKWSAIVKKSGAKVE